MISPIPCYKHVGALVWKWSVQEAWADLKASLGIIDFNPKEKPVEKDYYQRKSEGVSWGDYLYREWMDAQKLVTKNLVLRRVNNVSK